MRIAVFEGYFWPATPRTLLFPSSHHFPHPSLSAGELASYFTENTEAFNGTRCHSSSQSSRHLPSLLSLLQPVPPGALGVQRLPCSMSSLHFHGSYIKMQWHSPSCYCPVFLPPFNQRLLLTALNLTHSAQEHSKYHQSLMANVPRNLSCQRHP